MSEQPVEVEEQETQEPQEPDIFEDPQVRVLDDESVVIELSIPLKQPRGGDINEITLVPPEVGHLERADAEKGQIGKSIAFVAQLSGVPVGVLRKMRLTDFTRVRKVADKLSGN